VEHYNPVVYSDETSIITPPNLGSQGSQPLILADPNVEDCAHIPSPTVPMTANTGNVTVAPVSSSVLHSPVPCLSPVQPASAPVAAGSGGAQGPVLEDAPHGRSKSTIAEPEEGETGRLSEKGLMVYCDDITENGSVLNASSAWRSVTGDASSFAAAVHFTRLTVGECLFACDHGR
jgi:hypothetical protein